MYRIKTFLRGYGRVHLIKIIMQCWASATIATFVLLTVKSALFISPLPSNIHTELASLCPRFPTGVVQKSAVPDISRCRGVVTETTPSQMCEPCGFKRFGNWWEPIDHCLPHTYRDESARAEAEALVRNKFRDEKMLRRFDEWIRQQIPRDGIVLDIGANIGRFGLVAALRGAQVYFWETHAETANCLYRTLVVNKFNSRSTVFNSGVAHIRTRVNATSYNFLDDHVVDILRRNDRMGYSQNVLAWHINLGRNTLPALTHADSMFQKLAPKLVLIEMRGAGNSPYCDLPPLFVFLHQKNYAISVVVAKYSQGSTRDPGWVPKVATSYLSIWCNNNLHMNTDYHIWAEKSR